MQLSLELRPTTFQEVVGQPAVKALQNAIALGKVATSYTFVGPSGVGKTTLARIFAAGLNCVESTKPCGKCDTCKEIQTGLSECLIEIDAASDRGVAMVESLQDTVRILLPPNAWRVVVLDEAHQLSPKAWGAFLKTIEEPPPRNVFIFVTSEKDKIPATVRTRSQHFVFRSVPDDVVVKYLGEHGASAVMAERIAHAADGSLRSALQMLDQVLLVGEDELDSVLGTATEDIRNLADAVVELKPSSFFKVVDNLAKRGMSAEQIGGLLLDLSRDLYLVRTGCSSRLRTGLSRSGIAANSAGLDDATLCRLFISSSEFAGRYQKTMVALEALYVKFLSGS